MCYPFAVSKAFTGRILGAPVALVLGWLVGRESKSVAEAGDGLIGAREALHVGEGDGQQWFSSTEIERILAINDPELAEAEWILFSEALEDHQVGPVWEGLSSEPDRYDETTGRLVLPPWAAPLVERWARSDHGAALAAAESLCPVFSERSSTGIRVRGNRALQGAYFSGWARSDPKASLMAKVERGRLWGSDEAWARGRGGWGSRGGGSRIAGFG